MHLLPKLESRGPQWGPVEFMCPFHCLYLCPYFSLSVHSCCYLEIIKARSVIVHIAYGYNPHISNPVSVSIICLSVCLVVCRPFAIFVFEFNSFSTRDMITITINITITTVRVQSCNAVYHIGVQSTQVGFSQAFVVVYISVYLSLCLSLCLFVCDFFCRSNRAARNCAQLMWMQDTGSNTLSGSIMFPSVWSSAGLS